MSEVLLEVIKQPWRLLYCMARDAAHVCGVIRFDTLQQQEVVIPLNQLIVHFQQYFLAYPTLADRLQQYKQLCLFNPTYLHHDFKKEFQALLCFDI